MPSEFQRIEINFAPLRPTGFGKFHRAGRGGAKPPFCGAGRGMHPWFLLKNSLYFSSCCLCLSFPRYYCQFFGYFSLPLPDHSFWHITLLWSEDKSFRYYLKRYFWCPSHMMLLKGEAFYFISDIAMVPEILLLLFSNLHFVKIICVWYFHILKTFFPVVFWVKLKLEFRSEEGMECVISHLAEITMTLFSMPVLFLVVKIRTGIFKFSCIFHQIWKKKKKSNVAMVPEIFLRDCCCFPLFLLPLPSRANLAQ